MSEIERIYEELSALLEAYRVELDVVSRHGTERTEHYLQGKKDGVRIAMNLIHPLVIDEGQNKIQ